MKLSAPVALFVCYLVLVATHLYYPKWQQPGSEATLSYDVSGYYLYLPAVFIYNDLREVAFLPEIIEEYRPTDTPYQAYPHSSGNFVLKYSLGLALLYSPAFAVAHAYALASDAFPADGFSFPYQLAISLWSLLVAFLGLFVLMQVLRAYFSEGVTAATLLLIVAATNYLNYAAIDGALTHNYEFTLYALLLHITDRLYRRPGGPTTLQCLGIGGIIGLMALTRPTEIIAVLIPLLWDMPLTRAGWRDRLAFIRRHARPIAAAAAVCLSVGSLQLIYWKYVTGQWIEYSYQDQGFDWFEPHLVNGLFSYKAGWLTYTPAMWIAILGFVALFRYHRHLLAATLSHFIIFVYVAFSWSVWWYGGSLGQRTMVQAYAVLAFPLAAALTFISRRPQGIRWAFAGLCLLLTAHNLWFTHQAHRGGLLVSEWMNRSYYWRTLFTFEVNEDDKLLLDNPEFLRHPPRGTDTLYTNDFEDQPNDACGMPPIDGQGSYCLAGEKQNTEEYWLHGPFSAGQWLRATADFRIPQLRTGSVHTYAQLVLRFYRNGERVKERVIRLHRVLNYNFDRSVYIEARAPEGGAEAASVLLWNGGPDQPPILMDNLVVTTME
ncbi:hypothetical protein GGR26_001020 [Lewinella marina]|uniref:Glycosyltransferase RgtA/B/C/D-like domain-containing protein n=1 Tax=Neolewinella marina TaxID=438751 RepID=A0A2G0CI58_9BACT|nr:hypothetical protein [Neolewinella marina]NJB85275.1 hypothetical protein [Neolewinella marina]PHK99600.1 hypothetical protein CGL56_00690 [Neolewinella marina]